MSLAELIQSNFDAFNRQDADAILTTFADDAVYDHPLYPPPMHGKQAIREGILIIARYLTRRNARIVIDRITEDTNRAIVEWHVAPHDTPRRGVHVIEVNDRGLIQRIDVFPRG